MNAVAQLAGPAYFLRSAGCAERRGCRSRRLPRRWGSRGTWCGRRGVHRVHGTSMAPPGVDGQAFVRAGGRMEVPTPRHDDEKALAHIADGARRSRRRSHRRPRGRRAHRPRRGLAVRAGTHRGRRWRPSGCVLNFDNLHTLVRTAFRRKSTRLSPARLTKPAAHYGPAPAAKQSTTSHPIPRHVRPTGPPTRGRRRHQNRDRCVAFANGRTAE